MLYVQIHTDYLVNRLKLQGDLSLESNDSDAAAELKAKQGSLNAYTSDTLPSIKSIITTVSFPFDMNPTL